MAEEALAQLRADGNEPPFDLLLTDIALGPGMRGTELAQEVRQRWPRLAILLVSGYSSGALNTPLAWPLLSKPYSREALARAIVRALR
jgi:CheY-like chemotaxis protein